MGGLGYRHFGRLRRRVQIFGGSEKYVFVIFVRCAFVCVFVICLILVPGGCWCPGHKTAVCFLLCYVGVCLIPLSNMCIDDQGSYTNPALKTHSQHDPNSDTSQVFSTYIQAQWTRRDVQKSAIRNALRDVLHANNMKHILIYANATANTFHKIHAPVSHCPLFVVPNMNMNMKHEICYSYSNLDLAWHVACACTWRMRMHMAHQHNTRSLCGK